MEKSDYDAILLIICCVLIVLVIITIWGLKYIRFRYSHYTTFAILYGIITSAIVHQYINLNTSNSGVIATKNITVQEGVESDQVINVISTFTSQVYQYEKVQKMDMESVLSFHSTVFFNLLLPPIIFHAGYNLKMRHFTPFFAPILLFAFAGTVISAFIFSGIVYGFGFFVTKYRMAYQEALMFGSMISATDPVTVLAIFSDLKVDSGLYALIFGESVLNDAVSIVLSRVIKEFGGEKGKMRSVANEVFLSIGLFIGVFLGAIVIGIVVGLVSALITKLTKLRNYPEMEVSIFLLLSLLSYLVSQALGLSGIVTVLFCGITQGHYTFVNLSPEGRKLSKQFFSLINFLFENFIFVYIGLTAFVKMKWDVWLIFASLVGIIVSRFFNIYPLSFFANLCHGHDRVPQNFQHFLYLSGLRGAIPFALALEYSEHQNSHILVSTTFAIVVITVVFCGITTLPTIDLLSIKIGADDPPPETENQAKSDAGLLVRIDTQIISPIFTHKMPSPSNLLSPCLKPFFRLLLTHEQIANEHGMLETPGHEMTEIALLVPVDEEGYTPSEDKNLIYFPH